MWKCKRSHSFLPSFIFSFILSFKKCALYQRAGSLSSRSHSPAFCLTPCSMGALAVCFPFGRRWGSRAERAFMVGLRPAGWRKRGAAPVLSACPCYVCVAEAAGWHFLWQQCGGGGEQVCPGTGPDWAVEMPLAAGAWEMSDTQPPRYIGSRGAQQHSLESMLYI